MALSPGTQLGSYRIEASLGAGGMGEVYRARDTKLNRDVAIKVLLPAVANDRERLARFSREAQVLASLNHPHIAAIYGLEVVSLLGAFSADERGLSRAPEPISPVASCPVRVSIGGPCVPRASPGER